jgi:hypothetical protein
MAADGRAMATRWTLSALALGTLLLAPVHGGAATKVDTDGGFEAFVLDDSQVSLFLFTSTSTEASQARSALALDVMTELGERFSPQIKTGFGDAGALKGIATEFNIRARRCPKLLLFVQRARQAEVLELGETLRADAIEAQISALLKGLAVGEDGKAMKAVLAVGSPDEL